MSNKIYVNDVGTEIILDVGVDIHLATEHDVLWKSPLGVTGTWDGDLIQDDGDVYIKPEIDDGAMITKIRYITIADDIKIVGQWKLQAKVTIPTWNGRGETATFTVYDDMQ